MLLVIFGSETGDQKVIDVGITALQALQHLINKLLKCLGCFSQTKRHSHELKKTKGTVLGTSAGSIGIQW